MSSYLFEEVSEKNEIECLMIYLNNQLFFSLTEEVASTKLLRHDRIDRPESVDLQQKKFLLIREGKQAVGVIDYILDYPNSHSVYIGLLLIDDKKKGHGKAIISQLEKEFLAKKYEKICLAVLLNNPSARLFWEKLGFIKQKETMVMLNQRATRVSYYEKAI